MLNSAASSSLGAGPGSGGHAHITSDDEGLSVWHERSLACQGRELEQALADFAFVADVTTLASECRFAGDDETLVARYDELPFTAVAFHTQNGSTNPDEASRRVTVLTRRLIAPRETFYCLVSGQQRSLVESAFRVLESHEEWQMVFRGDLSILDPGGALPLTSRDLADMEALCRREGMMALEQDPLGRGPWYGVRQDGSLVAQGGTHLILSRAAEIGNIVTARSNRRRGYASQVVSALLHHLHTAGRTVFLQVFKDNQAAVACYEKLGFERLRTMYLVECRLAALS